MLVLTCLVSLALYPAFHLWTANFMSSQKHVVPGFLFAYLLAGVALERWWNSGSRVTVFAVLALSALWSGVQWYWQEHSWSDTRILARYLEENMARGERILAEASWIYILSLYPKGLIQSPSDVIDANYSRDIDGLDVRQIPWLVGNPDSADGIRTAIRRCGHRSVVSSAAQHYYFDTTRLRGGDHTVVVGLYRLSKPRP
jgi:hypothetical protein